MFRSSSTFETVRPVSSAISSFDKLRLISFSAIAICVSALSSARSRVITFRLDAYPEHGLNSRLDEIQAAILMERLNWLDEFTSRRRTIAEKYYDQIQNPAIQHMASPVFPDSHVFHLFVVRCQARDALIEHLHSKGVQSLIHYPIPVHHQTPCLSTRRDPEGLTSSERHAESCLSIPCHPQLFDLDVERVVDAMNSFQRA